MSFKDNNETRDMQTGFYKIRNCFSKETFFLSKWKRVTAMVLVYGEDKGGQCPGTGSGIIIEQQSHSSLC